MKQQLINITLILIFSYVIPSAICAVFATWHNKDNPFKYGSEARKWVFLPAFNVLCALIVIYYVCIELTVKGLWKWITKKFKEWNKE